MLSLESGLFLIVDDNEGLRVLIEAILESAGAQSISATNKEEAITLLRQKDCSIHGVLLDLNLDNDRGEELFDEIVAINSEIAIFPMSGCDEQELKERVANKPVDGIISKPFTPNEFISILKEGLASKTKTGVSGERV